MTLTQADIDMLRQGTASAGNGDTAPNGHNINGALNQLEQTAEEMDAYGLSDPANLPGEKQAAYEAAHEDLQHWLRELSNLLAVDMVGQDDSIELPNGTTVSLPRAATSASGNSATLPDRPGGAE